MTTYAHLSNVIINDPLKLRAWVIYQLKIKGESLAGLARKNNLSRSSAYKTFDKPYPRMEAVIAAALGLEPVKLWPSRYDKHGLPIRKRRTP